MITVYPLSGVFRFPLSQLAIAGFYDAFKCSSLAATQEQQQSAFVTTSCLMSVLHVWVLKNLWRCYI